ncbi:ABC transporter ATP-binding protein [Nonomuraea sp. FMUSA5-5]|uniref:ABC transporter ATP-binding protein n=1 Tax=Nonomuraea composti TaxID=2720023 RepID=A0ABX1B0P8_9ACTN|nr:ABC transporter ATP-binding protein [Nonomuraea sp. FMUSA5-5]NJP88758.1 ABC transporter ATP-binding protein [Nonomuraea sp. FMUSA5-5]
MAVLSAAGLSAGYRGPAVLHEVRLDYDPGLHVLLGPNGAGKTTLFRVLSGVLPPRAGGVLVDGADPHTDAMAKLLVGMAAHRAALAPRLSVADNLGYWARVLRLPAPTRQRRVEQVIDTMRLTGIAGQKAGSLSRGQAQRVGVAKALLGDPPVLLLDEPTAGLDPGMAAGLRERLRLLADAGRTIVVSTHELAEASELADDVTVLHQGRVVARGEPGELRQRLVGQGYRLRVRGHGDLLGALRRLGYAPEAHGHDGATVQVAGEEETETLVAALVRDGVGIREATAAGNPLQDVYLHLQG